MWCDDSFLRWMLNGGPFKRSKMRYMPHSNPALSLLYWVKWAIFMAAKRKGQTKCKNDQMDKLNVVLHVTGHKKLLNWNVESLNPSKQT